MRYDARVKKVAELTVNASYEAFMHNTYIEFYVRFRYLYLYLNLFLFIQKN